MNHYIYCFARASGGSLSIVVMHWDADHQVQRSSLHIGRLIPLVQFVPSPLLQPNRVKSWHKTHFISTVFSELECTKFAGNFLTICRRDSEQSNTSTLTLDIATLCFSSAVCLNKQYGLYIVIERHL